MKAKIDQYGRLVLRPETETESYALQCWVDKSLITIQSAKMMNPSAYKESKVIITEVNF